MSHFRPGFEALGVGRGRGPRRPSGARGGREAAGRPFDEYAVGAVPDPRPSSSEPPERLTRPRLGSPELTGFKIGGVAGSPAALAQGLRMLGLSVREGKMFLTLIPAPLGAHDAAVGAGLHRATGYRVLLRLLDRGVVSGDGRTPQQFRAVDPSVLFHRMELFYRDETEIPSFFAEALVGRRSSAGLAAMATPGSNEPPKILAAEGRSAHPALLRLAEAKRSVSGVIRPLAAPVQYRVQLARTLGALGRNGVTIRLITDATPADFRFVRAIGREMKGLTTTLQVRHYCPVLSQMYSIDRQRVIRVPGLTGSNRSPPVAIQLDDPARVRSEVSRFEALWTEAGGASQPLRSTRTSHRPPRA